MDPLLPIHRQELEIGSAIDPAVIARRGYRTVDANELRSLGFAPQQCLPGYFQPIWTTAGVQVGGLLKPDKPRTGEKGKPLKYEAALGSAPLLDIHPGAQPLVRDASIPLWFTEGAKKSDALWSQGVPCCALTGVYTFLHSRLVVPDFDDIALSERTVYVVFDSDVTRKSSVANALLRFCAALRRRGAVVHVVYLPEGQSGAKVGADDFLVAGGTIEELLALAKPWDGAGPGIQLRRPGEPDEDVVQLFRLILNPSITRNELTTIAAVALESSFRLLDEQVRPDGRVVLSNADIARDWRPKPPKGEPRLLHNPSDGSRPRLSRDKAREVMKKSTSLGLIDAIPEPVRRTREDGSTYVDTVWAVKPAATIGESIAMWANRHEDKVRAPRRRLCSSCGEEHARVSYCSGCGARITPELESASANLMEPNGPSPSPPIDIGMSAKKVEANSNEEDWRELEEALSLWNDTEEEADYAT